MFLRRYCGAIFLLLIVSLFSCGQSFAAEQGVLPGNMRLYLFKSGTGVDNTGVNDFHVSFGDTITVDAHVFNSRNEAIAGLGIYLTVDDRYFDIVPQGTNEKGSFRPFKRGNYMLPAGDPAPYDPVGNWTHKDSLTAADNLMDGWQLDYVQVSGINPGGARPVSTLRYGTACTFQLIAKAPCDSVMISLDSDNYYGRISSYLIAGANDSYSFRTFQTCYITVSGIQITPALEDIRMLAGTSNSSLDLDTHVGISSVPDSLLIWSVSGGTSITANIDSTTHVTTFTTPAGFQGSEEFIFVVGNGKGVTASDTMRVTVDSPPSLVATAFPDTIRIHEDSLETVLYLPSIVTDPDDGFSSLRWFFVKSGNNLTSTVAHDSLSLKGVLNYNGITSLRISVYDAFGLGDSLSVPVQVIPVNDRPVFSALPNVTVQRTASYTLNAATYATDADGDVLTLTWATPAHLVVTKSGMVLTISGSPGYLGSERLRLTVTDPTGLSATDSLLVTLTPATNPPVWSTMPKTCITQNQTDSSLVIWNYVTDPDDADSLLAFVFSGLSAVDHASVNPRNGRLILSDTDNTAGWDRITVTVTDPDGNSATTRFSAFIGASDGTPIVAGVPDTVVVAGSQMQWIDLDDYYYDINNSDSEIQWSWGRQGTADSSATVSINPMSHIVYIRGLDAEKTGINRLYFRATDPDGKYGEDAFVITAVILTAPVLDLPAKVGFAAGSSCVMDLDDYVYDSIYLQSDLSWAWSGNTQTTIALTTADAFLTRPVTFSGASTWTGWEKVAFETWNPLGGAAQDTMIVFSASATGAPVAGGLGPVYLKAGSGTYISLDNYAYDVGTADNLLKWSVAGGDSVKASITASTRIVYINAPSDTWEGQNTLTFTVTDLENNSATMQVAVVITDAVIRNAFSMSIFRNPMQEDYVDLYIASDSTVTLAATPTAKVYASGDSTAVILKTVSTGYYHGSYVLPLALSVGQKDSASVSVKGNTTSGKSVSKVNTFAYGKVDSSGAKITVSRIVLDIPAGALTNPELVTLIPSGGSDHSAETVSGEVELAASRVSIGPRRLSAKRAMRAVFPLDGTSCGAGVFRIVDGAPVFVGGEVSSSSVSAEITGGGVYTVGFDRVAPTIRVEGLSGGVARIVLSDRGSGLDRDAFRVTCDGTAVPFVTEADSVITVDLTWLHAGTGAELTVSAADRLGNETLKRVALDASVLPLQLVMEGNTPNPFNPSTHIAFTISRETDVRIEIYDVVGRRIAILANRRFSAGRHDVQWEARDDQGREVSSGAYFCRMIAGSRSETRKMLFLR